MPIDIQIDKIYTCLFVPGNLRKGWTEFDGTYKHCFLNFTVAKDGTNLLKPTKTTEKNQEGVCHDRRKTYVLQRNIFIIHRSLLNNNLSVPSLAFSSYKKVKDQNF